MLINVTYFAQAAAALGIDSESFEATDLAALVKSIHEAHGDAAVGQICDETGTLVSWVMVDVDGIMVRDATHAFDAPCSVRFLSPISGG